MVKRRKREQGDNETKKSCSVNSNSSSAQACHLWHTPKDLSIGCWPPTPPLRHDAHKHTFTLVLYRTCLASSLFFINEHIMFALLFMRMTSIIVVVYTNKNWSRDRWHIYKWFQFSTVYNDCYHDWSSVWVAMTITLIHCYHCITE